MINNSVRLPVKIDRIIQKQTELEELRSYKPNDCEKRYNLLFTMFLMLGERMSDDEDKNFQAKLNELVNEKSDS